MSRQPRRPLALLVCGAMVKAAAHIVPPLQRGDWKREWQSEVWHRWQFLFHAGGWNQREALLLLRRCMGVFPDALWHLSNQDAVQTRMRSIVRSPWTCLGSLGFGLLALAALTLGLPATRSLFQTGTNHNNNGLAFIWFHPSTGGGDEGLPPDAIAAWSAHSRLLSGLAPFAVAHPHLRLSDGRSSQPLVIRTQRSLFGVLAVEPLLGEIPVTQGVVLTNALWHSLYRADRGVLASKVRIGRDWYPITAVLPADFHFLSRQPAMYLVQPFLPDAQLMVVGRVKTGVTEKSLDAELTRIAQSATYYFFQTQLRYSFISSAAWIPVKVFAGAVFASVLLLLLVSRAPLRRIPELWRSTDRKVLTKRVVFFSIKAALACVVIFVMVLEWSRSESAILYASRDPAAGPFLLWLYILGAMGVLFWAVADQRARCRVCLRLLCFPVRVGCPGCLLLNWSGTELLCPEGHGLMHVPDLAPSWHEGTERWISLDESWKDLFVELK